MRILKDGTPVFMFIGGSVERLTATYVPKQGYKLTNATGTVSWRTSRHGFYLSKVECIEAEMKKLLDKLIQLETIKREIAV